VGLSRFKSITSQNTSQSDPIHSNTHVISITEQALKWNHGKLYKEIDGKLEIGVRGRRLDKIRHTAKGHVLGFMGLAQLSYSNKSQENLKSPYKWMAKG
jgi:hypothetical protein